jgi:hypothetical protein
MKGVMNQTTNLSSSGYLVQNMRREIKIIRVLNAQVTNMFGLSYGFTVKTKVIRRIKAAEEKGVTFLSRECEAYS